VAKRAHRRAGQRKQTLAISWRRRNSVGCVESKLSSTWGLIATIAANISVCTIAIPKARPAIDPI